jgi:hypothetical protein
MRVVSLSHVDVAVDEHETMQGRIQGGRTQHVPPPKTGKNKIFLHNIVLFHTKYPKNFRASLRNWKKYDFLA